MVRTRSLSLDEILTATKEDEGLNQLKRALLRGHFLASETSSKIYSKVFNEFCVTADGLVLRGLRIVLPKSLQATAIKLAHEGHLCICETKSLLRAKV